MNEKPRDVQKRTVLKLGKEHAAILEYGVRSRYTDYKVCVIQAMNAKRQAPPRGTLFTLKGPDTYWVQTTCYCMMMDHFRSLNSQECILGCIPLKSSGIFQEDRRDAN